MKTWHVAVAIIALLILAVDTYLVIDQKTQLDNIRGK